MRPTVRESSIGSLSLLLSNIDLVIFQLLACIYKKSINIVDPYQLASDQLSTLFAKWDIFCPSMETEAGKLTIKMQ